MAKYRMESEKKQLKHKKNRQKVSTKIALG
jgi:hypothetical protein